MALRVPLSLVRGERPARSTLLESLYGSRIATKRRIVRGSGRLRSRGPADYSLTLSKAREIQLADHSSEVVKPLRAASASIESIAWCRHVR